MVNLREEELRINSVYHNRDKSGKDLSYTWHQLDVAYMSYRHRTIWACALKKAGFKNLGLIDILDIGCGAGGWLRMMMEWGANPGRLHGVDLLTDRIAKAKSMSPSEIDFQVSNSWPLPYSEKSMDLVGVSTVFSSILDAAARKELARDLKRVLRAGGWAMIFDFAVSDPRNRDTIGIRKKEIKSMFPEMSLVKTYRLILAPPLVRRFPVSLFWICHFIETVAPILCTHRLYVLQNN